MKVEQKVKFTSSAITLDLIVRDFKLGSYFSLGKAVPNMTLTLNSPPKVKILETPIKEN